MAKPKVFLDSSVVIAALLSSSGGAFYILNNFNDFLDFQINNYVLEEINRSLRTKLANKPDLRTKLFLILGTAQVNVLPDESKHELHKLEDLISEKDRPVLASALKSSDYLLTLDKEFMKKSIIDFASRQNLVILNTKNLFEIFRKNNNAI